METQTGNLISKIKYKSDRLLSKVLAEKNIDAFNGAQGRILYVLWQKKALSPAQIAKETGLAPTTLSGMIERMERQGLAQIQADEKDKRKKVISLTAQAQNLKKDYDEISQKMTDITLRGFSQGEIMLFEEMLKKVLDNLNGE